MFNSHNITICYRMSVKLSKSGEVSKLTLVTFSVLLQFLVKMEVSDSLFDSDYMAITVTIPESLK